MKSDQEAKSVKLYIKKNIIIYFTLLSVIWISFWIYYGVGANTTKFENKQFFYLLIITVILIVIWMPKYTINDFTKLFIGGGIFMRIFYMLQTHYTQRTHDLGTVLDGTGHAGYIYTIYKTGNLPTSNEWQFYHPPFYHWLSAKVLQIFHYFYPNDDIESLFQCTKIVSCFASCATLLIMKQICDECKLSAKSQAIVMAIMAFYPNYYLLAGRVNNDSLVIMFIMIIVLFTIRWYYNQTMWNIVGIALGFGFGMMTKMNASTLAVLVGPIFLYILFKKWKEKKHLLYLKQYIVFALISFPLGLWYPIRNYIEFNQPFQYVMPVDPNSCLARASYSVGERFLPNFKDFFEPIYTQVLVDYNIPVYVIKSSMFGEFSLQNVDSAAKLLITLNAILMISSIIAMIYVLVNKKEKRFFIKWGLFAFWALLVLTYISFNISYPFSCTMDYRYIVPTSFTGAVFLALAFERLLEKNTVITKIIAWGVAGTVGCFSITSIYIYCIVK